MSAKDTITLGVQAGDSNAGNTTEPYFMPLRKLLASMCKGPYSPEVDEFALILRIDGEGWHWDFEGCQKLRRSKKDRYITIDIGVPRNRWENVSPTEMRLYLVGNMEVALRLCIDRLIKDKVEINADGLMADLQKVKAAYLLDE